MSRTRKAILGMGLAVVVAGVAMVLAPSFYDVVDEGRHLRPYESGVVYKIDVADSVTVYAAKESQPDLDSISGSALVALATAAFIACLLLVVVGGPARLRRFYAWSTAGFAFLAADELFAIHETISHNLVFLSDVPGVERPDDLIIALYLIPAAAFLVYFRDVLASSRQALWLFCGAIATFAMGGLADIAGVSADELLEVVTAGLIAAGFVTLLVAHLSQWVVGTEVTAPAAPPVPAEAPPARESSPV